MVAAGFESYSVRGFGENYVEPLGFRCITKQMMNYVFRY